jgi:hypothetical protein
MQLLHYRIAQHVRLQGRAVKRALMQKESLTNMNKREEAHEKLKPKKAIRRFDVFAEYNRQKAMQEGTPRDEAAGYGLWLAKVVAARKFRRSATPPSPAPGREVPRAEETREVRGQKWRTLDDKPQTDDMFHKEIVDRMGEAFYREVFVPAIRDALARGEEYTAIRDAVRADWKP